jgi:hypothetical protein
MKKILFLAALIFISAVLFRGVEANTTEENHKGWYKANKLVAECIYEKKRLSCLKVWLSRNLIIDGKNIKNSNVINTGELHASFFQVRASITVIPHNGKYVLLVFTGRKDFTEFTIWKGYDIATVEMETGSPYKEPVHITAYVPKDNSVGFARVNGEVTIYNEHLFHEVQKKAPSKTTFRSIKN